MSTMSAFTVLLAATLVLPLIVTSQSPPYDVRYFDQTLDHFNYVTYGDKSFAQRYMVKDVWWKKGQGPIFFYTGNEGPIDAFWNNSGFLFDIAPQFQAMVVFAEHRYYGDSLPFGNDTFLPQNMGLLTIEQALADYAVLIGWLKESLNATDCPVICFGGSYGGMLSAYMRFKYPNLVTGSIAASAPIYLLTSTLDRNFFFNAVTADFNGVSASCENNVRQAFIQMKAIQSQGQAGLQKLSTIFKTCYPLNNTGDYYHLLGWVRNSFTSLAMFDYPYPTSFLGKLPAYPVKVACQDMLDASDLVQGLAKAAGLFYNGTDGSLKCFDIYKDFVACADQTGCGVGNDGKAWDYQACTEIYLTNGSNNKTDMFPELPFTKDMRRDYCKKRWNVIPRDNWGHVEFWGKAIQTASNIVFSNGNLDPWMGGGVLTSLNKEIQAVTVKGGAHHLDLRGMNPIDPIGVKEVREAEKQAIRKWINQPGPLKKVNPVKFTVI